MDPVSDDESEEVQVQSDDKSEEVQVQSNDESEEVQVQSDDESEEVQVQSDDESEEVQVQSDDESEEVNGTEELSGIEDSLKNLPIDEVLVRSQEIVAELKKLEEYPEGEEMRYQKMLDDFYQNYTSHSQELADTLGGCGYAALTVKMLKTMNTMDILESEDVWLLAYYTYHNIWNFSDASEKLAKDLAKAGAVELLTFNLGHEPYLSTVESKKGSFLLQASLSILHNIARCSDVKHHFKENKTAEVIMPFTTLQDEFLKVVAMMTMAYIVEESENSKLIDETDTILNIVQWIDKAVNQSDTRRFQGSAPWELTQGLDKLAVNDANKMKVVESGALPVFLKMLRHDDPKEQSKAAKCIWTLSFDKNVRQKIMEQEGLVSTLELLAKSEHSEVKKNAQGALWIIKGENDTTTSSRPKSTMKAQSHIFISYSWNEKTLVKRIRERLRVEGYRVWIDYEEMRGSTLQAMAEAVENSAVVLVCMSDKYKESPNCRTEGEYTYKKGKDYIPLMMQKNYEPDGWLGAILGTRLFFDFSGKYRFEKIMKDLLKELRGRGQASHNSLSLEDELDTGMVATEAPISQAVNPLKMTNGAAVCATIAMSRDDVSQWLSHHHLDVFIPQMASLDGKLLWQLKLMKDEAPRFFFKLLDSKLKLGFVNILRLAAAIDELH